MFAVPVLPTAQPQIMPDVSVASSAACPETVSEANTSISAIGPSPERLAYFYDRAAKAVLKQHHQYTEEDLVEFLAKEYPSVPQNQRRALIVGATSAAQSVANLHVLWKGFRTGTDPTSRETADAAERSLSFYNFGFMSRDRNDHLPQTIVTSAVPVPATGGGTAAVTIAAEGIPLLTVPVSGAESGVVPPRIDLEEEDSSGDDLGPPPSFEIVDGQPMSAQRPRTKEPEKEKRTVGDSSESGSGMEVPIHTGDRMKSLIDRIEYMVEAPETVPPPPSTRHPVVAARPAATGGRAPSARDQLPPVVDPAYLRRDVSPYVPAVRGPIPMVAYHPSARTEYAKPHYYPGTLLPVTSKKTPAPSAAARRPPSESAASARPWHEPRREPGVTTTTDVRTRKESSRRERSPERRSRRGDPSCSRSPPPRDRRTSTPPRDRRSRRKHLEPV